MVFWYFILGRPLTNPCLASSSIVPKFKWDNLRCHNQDLVFEALDKRKIGEDFNISSNESVYKLVSLKPVSRSAPSKLRTKQSLHIINPRNCDISDLIVTIPYNLCNLINTKSGGSLKLVNKVDKLRALSGHVLGATQVQVPEDDLDDLQWTREEDGEFETVDP
ncbi:hypothetical protein Tco_0600402 [Tanacetum coccineum]|uniref:Uncharacterized protein n=1 Tax=Tanacetum coccineum TaxID=301880 RepID=A0ABQ4WBN3_9ASTR